jgi:hypothetical protein
MQRSFGLGAIWHCASESSSAAKSSSAPDTLLELLHNDNIRCVDALDDQLSDAVAFLDREVDLAEVEEDHLDLSTIVGIDDTCTRVDAVFGS